MPRNDGLNERLLENENNRLSDQLAGKISKLKAISIEMKVNNYVFTIVYYILYNLYTRVCSLLVN